jgi:hypothetical protein
MYVPTLLTLLLHQSRHATEGFIAFFRVRGMSFLLEDHNMGWVIGFCFVDVSIFC